MKLTIFDKVQNKTSQFAIDELTYYLKAIFDFELGKTTVEEDANVLLSKEYLDNNDTIGIEMKNGNAILTGNSDVSILIAVYRLLSEFGAVFTRPGRKHELIPSLTITDWNEKELSIHETASYKHRGVCIEGADSYQNTKEFLDWLPKINMNSFFIQFENPYSFLKRWYEHEFNPYADKEDFNTEIAQQMSDLLDEELSKRGLIHHRVGHGWTGEVLGYSSKYGWESGLKLPEEKKPLVAELNGKRELFNTAPILTSLCFSNPDVGERMCELIVNYAKERKDVDYLHVWLSDARNNICECEKCKQEIPSDQYVRILNQLDRKLSEEGLNTKICFLLYHELLFAPKHEVLENPERFTMMFAPITRTFEMSYADVDYENDVPLPNEYSRNNIVLPNSLEENLSYLFSWQKVFNGDSFVYDYPLGRAHYGDLGYMKISKVIFRDVVYLKKLGLNGYISCQELRAGFPHNFPNFVMGQMLWNRNLEYDELKALYFSSLYGSEWKSVVTYLEKLSDYSSCDYFNSIGDRQNAELSMKYNISSKLAFNFINTLEENVAKNNGIQRDAWRQLGYHREYVVKLANALHLMASGDHLDGQIRWKDFLDYIRNHEPDFQQYLDVYRIIEVAKNYAGFKL
ncbi:TPA: DUF4838 domain-containing protein [Streptococcus suis]|uniref:DUF4838 domain-containing protein n=3 Tax=Streptococcus suis TaxID=1307 RepID=A0A0H3N1S7_STRS4|nr:DUF4838 domain-containing protein [Streptococcus suis]ADV69312.1 hypothetical protein SSUJS14_0205 [Streptococcus suis JS14]AER14400.1 hypothetical protein SSU12_0203 [Streptococcus suis SS12]AER43534.1 hypothetical protein SSUA7_0199 [Streptococcus suis A7]AGZ22308.1 hypothetical protein T15_0195 [Streptococcus suis T15]AKG39637.1 hypothetical protein ZY05719_01125 [Streptococcus suis]